MRLVDRSVRTLEVNGTSTAYNEYGDGVPLVILHGGEADQNSALPVIGHLGDGLRVVTYDQRDTGGTRNGDGAYKMEDLADDCAALIRALGLDRAHIWGQSFGGMLAMNVAILHPDVVASVVLGSTSPGGVVGASSKAFLKARAVTAIDAGLEERARALAEIFFSDGFREAHPEVLAAMASGPVVVRPLEARYRRWAAWWGHDCTESIDRIVAPTLIMHGTADRAVPYSNAEWLAQRIPHAEVVKLEGCGHAITTEARVVVAALVRDFVLAHA